jgi:hypothetical protein
VTRRAEEEYVLSYASQAEAALQKEGAGGDAPGPEEVCCCIYEVCSLHRLACQCGSFAYEPPALHTRKQRSHAQAKTFPCLVCLATACGSRGAVGKQRMDTQQEELWSGPSRAVTMCGQGEWPSLLDHRIRLQSS